jgi:hypothetical protein
MFWRKNHPHSQEAEQMAASLEKNLHEAMPGLIHDAQTSGSLSPTFKLYHNLSVVCQLLDSLLEATKSGGKGDGPLALDATAMGHIRQDLAAYIERSAAALDSRSSADTVASSTPSPGAPGKPSTAPQKKPIKKRVIVN